MADKPLSILKRETVHREELICEHSYEIPVRKGRAHYVCRIGKGQMMTEQEKIELSKHVAEKYGIEPLIMQSKDYATVCAFDGVHTKSIFTPIYLYQDTARTMELAIEHGINIWYVETGHGECVCARFPENFWLWEYYTDHPSKKEAVLVAILRTLEAKE